jgi:hypothetical protein
MWHRCWKRESGQRSTPVRGGGSGTFCGESDLLLACLPQANSDAFLARHPEPWHDLADYLRWG